MKKSTNILIQFDQPTNFNINQYIDFGKITNNKLINIKIHFTKKIKTFIKKKK